jgi:hypothetical protein
MKSFNVQNLWDTPSGPSAGVPDYIVKKAQDSNSPLKLNVPDGRFMIIEVEKLSTPYKISEPIINRNFPSVGDVTYKYYNYLFEESSYSSGEDQPKEELLEEGNYNSFEDLKKISYDREATHSWSRTKVMPVKTTSETGQEYEIESVAEVAKPVSTATTEASYTILTKKVVETFVPSSTTFWGYIGHVMKTKREELNLTDTEVVERIRANKMAGEKEFSVGTYRSIEKGEATNSKMNTYIHIAEALDLHVSELIPPKPQANESEN